MNLQQLRYIHEVARRGLNVSDAADALFTSQPGVSKQIRQLETELGVEIFERHGKRLVGVSEPGRAVLAIAERILKDIDNLQQVGDEFSNEAAGSLSIATTHTQARYMLPRVVHGFLRSYPQVKLSLHQGSPRQVCEMVLEGSADIAIATESGLITSSRTGTSSHPDQPGACRPLSESMLPNSRITVSSPIFSTVSAPWWTGPLSSWVRSKRRNATPPANAATKP